MWRLTNIKAENIISFRNVELSVEQRVATLIFGENHDSDKQKNNGSGKSSVIEAISFGITGEPLRKVKVEEIINDSADTASVIVRFWNDFNGREFVIKRTIYRDKTPQKVECFQVDADGNPVNEENTIQPTVADYNRFILDELGVSKDELYNNYILCRNKYLSFFESSDKEKKEIINRFSDGDKVDDSIAALADDISIAETELSDAQMEESKVNGRIEAIDAQIEQAEQKMGEFEESKMSKIAALQEKIETKNNDIAELRGKIRLAKERLSSISDLDNEMLSLESSKDAVLTCYKKIEERLLELRLTPIVDYSQRSAQYEKKMSDIEKEISEMSDYVNGLLEKIPCIRAKCTEMESKIKKSESENERMSASENKEIDKIQKEWDCVIKMSEDVELKIDDNRKKQSTLRAEIANLEALLRGVVTCPSCGHQFVLSNNVSKEDVEMKIDGCRNDLANTVSDNKELFAKMEEYTDMADEYDKSINEISDKSSNRSNEISLMRCDLSAVRSEFENMMSIVNAKQNSMLLAKENLKTCESAINGMRRTMFDEVFDHIDTAIDKGKAFVKQCNESIEAAKSSISIYESSIEEIKNSHSGNIIESLEKSKQQYKNDLRAAKKIVSSKLLAYDELKRQEKLFVEFKTHLANTKIDAISKITNKVLEDIGSDIRIELQGFKVLKTGKIREKITVQVLRNGVDCGSFEKMSAGERARICLANIIALQALINSNASDNGKGLDFMAIDEIMDVSDEVGLMSYCDVINRLGITVLMITQGMVSEGYQHKLLVVKEGGISNIVS